MASEQDLHQITDEDELAMGLVKRFRQISVVKVDFTNMTNPTNRHKRIARGDTIDELVSFISSRSDPIPHAAYSGLFLMIQKTCLRPLAPETYHKPPHYEIEEDDEPYYEPAWEHLEMLYNFFMKFLSLPELHVNTAKQLITPDFMNRLMQMFDSKDSRERDFIKTIVHKIYGRFISLRPMIRKMIHNIFYEAIYEAEIRNGLGEMLEIIGSIINGFAVPVKLEHKLFLVNCLMPLHKTLYIYEYFEPLVYCLSMYLQKDPTLVVPVVKKMIRFWPSTHSRKEILMLNELEEFLAETSPELFAQIAGPVAKRIGTSLQSAHFQVSQRTMQIFDNSYVMELVKDSAEKTYPILLTALTKNLHHWNRLVKDLTVTAIHQLKATDRRMYDKWVRSSQERRTDDG